MKVYYLILLILISTVCFSDIHHFTNAGSDYTRTTQQLFDAGNIAIGSSGEFLIQRWPIEACVNFDEDGNGIGIASYEFGWAVEEAVNEYYFSMGTSSPYLIYIDYNIGCVDFEFSDDPDDFVNASANPAEAHVYAADNVILNSTYVMFNDTFEFYSSNSWVEWNYGGDGFEPWISIERVALHEMGHCLGIDHIWGGNTSNQNTIMCEPCPYDITLSELGTYDHYSVQAVYSILTVDGEDVLEKPCSILINHPNPFNPSTTISYSLVDDIIDPQIEIYNVKGQKVKSYQLENIIGENSIVWDGKDVNNKSVSSGVYFYSLINEGKIVQSRKMLMIK